MAERRVRRGAEWWVKAVGEILSSPLSAAEACAERGVSTAQFYKWRHRLKGMPASASRSQSSSKRSSSPSSRFHAPIDLMLGSEIEIRTRTGRSVIVRGAVSSAQLREVLQAVEEVSV